MEESPKLTRAPHSVQLLAPYTFFFILAFGRDLPRKLWPVNVALESGYRGA